MANDKEFAVRSLDRQARARDYVLVKFSSYKAWSDRKAWEGLCQETLADLDETAMWRLPEEILAILDGGFEELLADLKAAYRD